MSEPKVQLVQPQRFAVDLPPIGAPMAIGAESDEIVVLMRLTLRPRGDVMNLDFNVAASRDSASVTRLNEDTALDVSRYWRAKLPADAIISHSTDMDSASSKVQ